MMTLHKKIREPGGRRYVFKNNHVEYLGWTFDWFFTPSSGVKIFNTRYKDDLVAYEISLAEAGTVYSGITDIIQSGTVYLDTGFGMGAGIRQQVLGVDCPQSSQLLNVTFLNEGSSAINQINSLCIFEEAGMCIIYLLRKSLC